MLNLPQRTGWSRSTRRTDQSTFLGAGNDVDVKKVLLTCYLSVRVHFVRVDKVLVRRGQGKWHLHDQF